MPEEDIYAEETEEERVATAIAARIVRGRQLLNACEDRVLDALRIDGKTLRQWGTELTVEIPSDNTDLRGLERASTELANATMKAERILALFEVHSTTSGNYHKEGFARRYVQELNAQTGRIAAEKINQIVTMDESVDAALAASQAAKLVVDYFKRIVAGHAEARKGLENRTHLIGLRLKYLHDDG